MSEAVDTDKLREMARMWRVYGVGITSSSIVEAADEIDKLRVAPLAEYPHEMYCPSIDVCAICSDSECDGISCLFGLCPDIDNDRELLEQVQTWVRLGRIQEQANAFLAVVENRT